MGLFDRILRRKAAPIQRGERWRMGELETAAMNTKPPILNPWLTTTPIYPTGDYFVYSTQGFERNELVYAGMRRIMDAVAMTPLRIYDAHGNPIDNHPARKLLERPNPFMGEHLLWEMTVLYLYLAGQMFWVKVHARGGAVVELWPLRPDRVRILPSNAEYIAGYIYEIGGRQFPLDRADVIEFKFTHPIYEYLGLSPLQAALRRIAIDNEAADFTKVIFQNLAIPGVAIETQQAIDQAVADRLTTKWMNRFGGANRGKPMFMQAGMKVTRVALTMQELAFPDLDAANQTRVLMALGVPPILVGATAGLDASTYSNYEQARASFYEDTIQPLQARIDDRINHDLIEADFDGAGKIEARFDTSEVAALRLVRQQRHDAALKALAAGAITLNDYRARIGERAVAGGDIYLRPINLVAVPAANAAENPPAPAPAKPPESKALANASGAQNVEAAKKLALSRLARVDAFRPKFEAWARGEFRREGRDVMRVFDYQTKALTKDQAAAIVAELAALEAQWRREIEESSAPLIFGAMENAGDTIGAEIGIDFDLSNQGLIDFVRGYAFKFAQKLSATSAQDVKDLILKSLEEGWSHKELRDALAEKFSEWETSRAEMVAHTETMRAVNAAAVESYRRAGVKYKVWVADPDACPYCAAMDGTVVGVDDDYFKVGDTYHPNGAERPMTISYEDVSGPPLHPNCRCVTRAEAGV
jgi:HK97 family phage portal protein